MKTCNTCKINKELIEFHKDKTAKDKLCRKCKDCERRYYRIHKNRIENYRKINENKTIAYNKKYQKFNKDKYNSYTAKRRASKLSCTPSWLTLEHHKQIHQIYLGASNFIELTTGIKHEVDHIIPLQGKLVCGLHVPWNLQILSQHENRVKSNQFDGTNENETWKNFYLCHRY